jgi:chemotaxis signal transduction protein
MEQERSFCLFQTEAGPMAVSVDSVAAVLETATLVPLPWSPPQVVGLCPYHREVLPVISMGTVPAGDAPGRASGPRPAPAAEAPRPVDQRNEEKSRYVVLILRAEQEAWAIRIDPIGTMISRECFHFHPPRTDEHARVFIGAVGSAEASYAVLDAPATWRGLRSAVASWYGLINGPNTPDSLSLGEEIRS